MVHCHAQAHQIMCIAMPRPMLMLLVMLLCMLLQAVDKFLQAKGKLDGNASPSLNDVTETLHALTTVRATLAAGLSSGQHPNIDARLTCVCCDSCLVLLHAWHR